MKRLAIILAVLGLVLGACGEPYGEGGQLTLPDDPTTTVSPTTAVTTTTAPTTTTTTTTSSTTLPVSSTTSTPSSEVSTSTTTVPSGSTTTMGVKVYFLLDGGGSPTRPGPFLVPVYREIPRTQQVATAAMRQLLAGPTQAERESIPSLSSAVPADTALLGITIDDGVATVDLAREFESGGGTFSMTARLAQVVFTVSQFPTVDLVEFRLDGDPVSVFSGEGIVLDDPVGREDFRNLTPAIFVDSPAYGAPAGAPMRVQGVAAVFEGRFAYTVTNWDGLIIATGFAQTDNGMGWGDFDFTIPYDVDHDQIGSLIVFDHSAQDGSMQNVREHPVWLEG